MTTYKKYITINDPNHVVLSGLPFRSGQQVEVVVIAKDEQSSNTLEELQKLFKITQALPQAQTITEDEIATEIAAYRSKQ